MAWSAAYTALLPFEIVARFVILPLDVATTVEIHKILQGEKDQNH